jgi:hypothetical protein
VRLLELAGDRDIRELCNPDRIKRVKKSDCVPAPLKECIAQKCKENFQITCTDPECDPPGGPSAGGFVWPRDASRVEGIQPGPIAKVTLCPLGMSGRGSDELGPIGAIMFHEVSHICGYDRDPNTLHNAGICAACAAYPSLSVQCSACRSLCQFVSVSPR